jgi:hypothetical protein
MTRQRWIAHYLVDGGDGAAWATTRVVEAASKAEAMKVAGARGPDGLDFVLTVRPETPEQFLGHAKADAIGKIRGIKRAIDDPGE